MTEVQLYEGYRTPPPDRAVEGVVLLNAVEERIRELLGYRKWFRLNRWADWPPERHDYDVELRALVKLARKSRAIAAPDPIDQFKGWTESEKAYGR